MKRIVIAILAVIMLGGCAKVTQESLPCDGTKPQKPFIDSVVVIPSGSYGYVSALSSSGSTFRWTGPNGFTSSDNFLQLSGSYIYGQYTVRSILNGCASDVTTFTVSPYNLAPPPCSVTIPNRLSASNGNSFNFSGAGYLGSSYCGNTNYQIQSSTTSGYIFYMQTNNQPSLGSVYSVRSDCYTSNQEAFVYLGDAYGMVYYKTISGNVYCNTINGRTYVTFCSTTFKRISDNSTFTITGSVEYQ
jgi:hypothetical protein